MVFIAPPAGRKDPRFIHVFNRVIAPRHIAVDRRISNSDFGFIARRQQHFPKFIGLCHEEQPAHTRLDVFLGQPLIKPCEQGRKCLGDSRPWPRNAHRVIFAAQRVDDGLCIIKRRLRGVFRRQHHAAHIFWPKRICRNCRHDRAVDPAGQPKQACLETGFAEIIAQRLNHGPIILRDFRRQCRFFAARRHPSIWSSRKVDMRDSCIEQGQLQRQLTAAVQHK